MAHQRLRYGELCIDPKTGDEGQVVSYRSGIAIGRTKAGRVFYKAMRRPRQINAVRIATARSIMELYRAGEAKVVNCACCTRLLLGDAHREAVAVAKTLMIDLHGLPQLVAGYVFNRPHCKRCLKQANDERKKNQLARTR